MKKISKKGLIISHGDMDGIMSAVLVKLARGGAKSNLIIDCDMRTGGNTSDQILKKYDLSKISSVFVLDRTFFTSMDTVKNLRDNGVKTTYIDHHVQTKTNKCGVRYAEIFLEEWPGFESVIETDDSATKLVFNRYRSSFVDLPHFNIIEKLTLAVDSWDVFKWKGDPTHRDMALKLQAFTVVFGFTLFRTMVEKIVINGDVDHYSKLLEMCDLSLAALEQKMNITMENANVIKREVTVFSHRPTLVFIEASRVDNDVYSLVADKMFSEDPNIFMVIRVGSNNLGVRRNPNHECRYYSFAHILAQKLGNIFDGSGGGHKDAAGASFGRMATMEEVIDIVCSDVEYIPEPKGNKNNTFVDYSEWGLDEDDEDEDEE